MLGTYLTDLTYIEDGNENNLDGIINFSKREMISKVIKEITDYQQFPYNNIKPNPSLLEKLTNLPEASEALEKRLWKLSKSLE